MPITRRSLIKATVAAGVGGAVAGVTESDARGRGRGRGRRRGRRDSTTNSATGPFGYTPFTATFELPHVHNNALVDPDQGTIHSGIDLNPRPGTTGCEVGSEIVYHGCAPETHRDHPVHVAANSNQSPEFRWDRFDNGVGQGGSENHYLMSIERSTHEFIPGIQTQIFGYASAEQDADYDLRGTGVLPGPTVLARHGQPTVMRIQNNLGEPGDLHSPECSVHLHGGHTPAHSDGFPDFYILPGCKRDCFYPNTGPRSGAHPAAPGASAQEIAEAGNLGPFSPSDIATTMWYHEHGMDITGYLVSRGLSGFYLMQDDIELDLIQRRVLPPFYTTPTMPGFNADTVTDIPLALMDQLFDATGTQLPYNFMDHNGRIGDVFTINGVAQPYFEVERRKYRLRFLNASNARIYHLRLSHGGFIQLGQDSWEFPEAIATKEFTLVMAQRVDAVVDFRDAPDEVYLENLMHQTDGRGPKGGNSRAGRIHRNEPTPLMKFVVRGPKHNSDVSVDVGTQLRPFERIREDEVTVTRHFSFERRRGAWVINREFFSPRTTNAAPVLNSTERWIFENKSGGWWHPIHIHLESHQILKFNGEPPPPNMRYNVDVSNLEPHGSTEFLIKFRTFTGPFVFHCHNLEHEDMRMMHVFDPVPEGYESFNNGTRSHDDEEFENVYGSNGRQNSGLTENEEQWEYGGGLFFESEGDVELLHKKHVGFPASDFLPGGQIVPGAPDDEGN